MDFVYLDESGDQGAKGSDYLVLTLMITSRKKEIKKIIRETKKKLLNRNKTAKWLTRMNEIKFYGFPDQNILKDTLKKLSELDLRVYALVTKKKGKFIPKTDKSFVIGTLLEDIHVKCHDIKPKRILADLDFFDREKEVYFRELIFVPHSKENGAQKIAYQRVDYDEYTKLKDHSDEVVIKIEHCRSQICEELQAIDLISGSIYAAFERKDEEYLDILKSGKTSINIRKRR